MRIIFLSVRLKQIRQQNQYNIDMQERTIYQSNHSLILSKQEYFSSQLSEERFKHIIQRFTLMSYIGYNQRITITKRYKSEKNIGLLVDEVQILQDQEGKVRKLIVCTYNQDKKNINKNGHLIKTLVIQNEGIQQEGMIFKIKQSLQREAQEYRKELIAQQKAFIAKLLKNKNKRIDLNYNTDLQKEIDQDLQEQSQKNIYNKRQKFIRHKRLMDRVENFCLTYYFVKYFAEQLTQQEQSLISEKNIINSELKLIRLSKNQSTDQYDELHIEIEQNPSTTQMLLQNLLNFEETKKLSCLKRQLPGVYERKNMKAYLQINPIQPQNYTYQDKSYAIALQGGGAKGIAYLGAWQALRKHFQDNKIQVSAVIGSSIGAIIGLPIACGLSYEQIKDVCEKKFSTLISTDKISKNNSKKILRELIESNRSAQIQEFFYPTGSNERKDYQRKNLDEKIVQLDKKIGQVKPIDYINKWMHYAQSIGLISGPSRQNISRFVNQYLESFIKESIENNLGYAQDLLIENGSLSINYLLVCNSLMTGDTIKESNIEMLQKFFMRYYEKQFGGQSDSDKLKEIARTITLKQLYQMTRIQFTATSVDVDQHVLRFFNHKTTPDLPVCEAVRMSGSFPGGFQVQRWKQEWGKYYIQYSKLTRELNLVNNRFTDGGMLANFPIQYVDNKHIRKRYFSHSYFSDTNKTIIGLQLESNPSKVLEKKNYIKQIQKKGILKNLGSQILGLGKVTGGIVRAIFWDGVKGKFKSMFASKIDRPPIYPFFNLLIDLLKTYFLTKDKLTQQIFCNNIRFIPNQAFFSQKIIGQAQTLQQAFSAAHKRFTQIDPYSSNTLNQERRLFIHRVLQQIMKFYIDQSEVFKNTTEHKQILEKILKKFKKWFQQEFDMVASSPLQQIQYYKAKKAHLIWIQKRKIKVQKDIQNSWFFTGSQERQLQNLIEEQQKELKYIIQRNSISEQEQQRQIQEENIEQVRERALKILDDNIAISQQSLISQLQIQNPQDERLDKLLGQSQRFKQRSAQQIKPYMDFIKTKISSRLINQQINLMYRRNKYRKFLSTLSNYFSQQQDIMQTLKKIQRSQSFNNLLKIQKIKLHNEFRFTFERQLKQIINQQTNDLQNKSRNLSYQLILKIIREKKANLGLGFLKKDMQKNIEFLIYKIDLLINHRRTKVLNIRQVRKLIEKAQSIIHPFIKTHLKITQTQSKNLRDIKGQLSQIHHLTLFRGERFISDIKRIKDCLLRFKEQVIDNQDPSKKQLYQNICKQIFQNQKQYLLNLQAKWKDHKKTFSLSEKQAGSIKHEDVQELYIHNNHRYLGTFQQNHKYIKVLQQSSIQQINKCNQIYKHQLNVENYINQQVLKRHRIFPKSHSKSKSNQYPFHIVLQSHPKTLKLMHRFIQQIKQYAQKNNFSINAITGSDFNALLMFCHAADLPSQEILLKLNELACYDKLINEQQLFSYDKYQWIKEENKQKWDFKDKYTDVETKFKNIIFQIDENLKEPNKKETQNNIKKISQYSEVFSHQMDQLVNHIQDSIFQLQDKRDYDAFCQKLQLKYQKSDYNQINTNEDKLFKKVYGQLINIVEPFLPSILEKCPNLITTSQYQIFKKQKDLWKLLVMSKVVKKYQIKKFVKNILSEHCLVSPQINLKEFQQNMQKKAKFPFLLNFTTIDIKQSIITFINANTFPFMPVYAAVLSAMSLPFFIQGQYVPRQWNIPPQKKIHSKAQFYFDKNMYHSTYLVSSYILTLLPLHLLTNNKIRKMIGDEEKGDIDKQIFLSISQGYVQQQTGIKKRQIQFLLPESSQFDFYQLASLAYKRKGLSKKFINSIPIMQSLVNLKNVYMGSYDLMMMKIYKEDSIKLPVRISTLDFKSILHHDSKQLTRLGSHLINDSYFVMKQKIINHKKNRLVELQKRIRRQKKLIICVETFLPEYLDTDKVDIKKLNPNHVSIRFLTFDNKSKSVEEKNIVMIMTNEGWQKINYQFYKLNYNQKTQSYGATIKIAYPEIIYNNENTEIQSQVFTEQQIEFSVVNMQKNKKAYFMIPYSCSIEKYHQINNEIRQHIIVQNQDQISDMVSQNIAPARLHIEDIKIIRQNKLKNKQIYCLECFQNNKFQKIQRAIDQIYHCQWCFKQIKREIGVFYVCRNDHNTSLYSNKNKQKYCFDCLFLYVIQSGNVRSCPCNILTYVNQTQNECKICEHPLEPYLNHHHPYTVYRTNQQKIQLIDQYLSSDASKLSQLPTTVTI